MKTCVSCKEQKDILDFPLSGGNGRCSSRCKTCKKIYDRDYYLANKEKLSKQRKVTRKKSQDVARNFIWRYLHEHPCLVCGEKDTVVLEFDHRDPTTKKYNIGEMVGSNCSIKTIAKEIEKCDVLCANCHRRRTAKQFGWSSYFYSTGATLQDMYEQFPTFADIVGALGGGSATLGDVARAIIPSNPSEEWVRRNS